MLPLYDMLANAQNGQGLDLLAKQFDLNRQQAQLAMEALLPAFSEGLKRNAYDPMGASNFLSALASGNHARYFNDPVSAFGQNGLADGAGILGHLFGSKEVSRAIAQQAAQATGIGQDILKQMLPALASMIMGGLFQQSTNKQNAGGFGAGGNIIGEVIEQMMRQGTGFGTPQRTAPRQQAPQNMPNPFDNPFGRVLEEMFGGGAAKQERPDPGPDSPFGENPLGRIFEEMLGGGSGATRDRSSKTEQRPQSNPSGRERNPYDDLFGKMFESGREVRDEYQRGVESIFDQYMQGMNRHR